MCLGGGSSSSQNQIAQEQIDLAQQQNNELQQENATKQANITAGNNSINSAFAQFNPAYYNTLQATDTAAQTTPLAQEYARAKDTATADLAGRGLGSSSVGNQTMADIDQRNATEIGDISNNAANAVNTQKGLVNQAENNLYNLNSAGNDPTGIAANAIGAASSLVNPQTQPPLGNVFADLLTPLANYYKAGQGTTIGNSSVTGQPNATTGT